MGKQARARVLAEHQAKAVGRAIRTSPRKLNLVAQSIRGKSAEKALNELTFSPRRIAGAVKKVLQSAIANAENNHDLDVDELIITEASVGKNLTMKRFMARARGRGASIVKPFSQITIVVSEKRDEKQAKKTKKPEAETAKSAVKAKAPAAGDEAEPETKAKNVESAPKAKAPVAKAAKKPAKRKSAPKSVEEKA
jgi:large subunit ribosomal protein L22